jgi:N-acetylglucosamine-6-phosphate deacetylase
MTMISGGRIVTPDGILADGWLQTDGRTIARLGSGEPPEPGDRELDGAWVVPGFVDIHVHGGGRASYVPGDQDQAGEAGGGEAGSARRHGESRCLLRPRSAAVPAPGSGRGALR